MHSSVDVPPPRNHEGLVLAITGVKNLRFPTISYSEADLIIQLPPQCSSRIGWQMVKDLVRIALEHHGIIDRESKTKPGMVHMSSSSSEASDANETKSSFWDKHVVNNEKFRSRYPRKMEYGTAVAHINMKTPAAALHAYSKYIHRR